MLGLGPAPVLAKEAVVKPLMAPHQPSQALANVRWAELATAQSIQGSPINYIMQFLVTLDPPPPPVTRHNVQPPPPRLLR